MTKIDEQQEINERIVIIFKDLIREMAKKPENPKNPPIYGKFQYIYDKIIYLENIISGEKDD